MEVYHEQPDCVSLWIGTIGDEREFDALIEAEIVPSLMLGAELHRISEDAFEPELLTVGELLEGFTHWESFLEPAKQQAASYGVESANAALATYGVIVQDAPAEWGHFYFLGSFTAKPKPKSRRGSRPRQASDDY